MLLTSAREWYIQPENNNPANGRIGPWKKGFSGRVSSEVELVQAARRVTDGFATEKRVYLFGVRDATFGIDDKNVRSAIVSAPISNGIIGDFIYESELSQKLQVDDGGYSTISTRRPFWGSGTLYAVNDRLYNTNAVYPYTIDRDTGTLHGSDFAGTVDGTTRFFVASGGVFRLDNRIYYSQDGFKEVYYADILVNGRVGSWNSHPYLNYGSDRLIPVRNTLGGNDRVYSFPPYSDGKLAYVEINRTTGKLSKRKLVTLSNTKLIGSPYVSTGKFLHFLYSQGCDEDVDLTYLIQTGHLRRRNGTSHSPEELSSFTAVDDRVAGNGYILHISYSGATIPIIDDASLGDVAFNYGTEGLFNIPVLYWQYGIQDGIHANNGVSLIPIITSNRIYLFYAANIDDKDNVIVGYVWAPFNSTQLVSRYDIPRGNVRGAIHADSVTPQPVTKKGLGLFRMPTTFTVRGGLSVRQSPQPARVRASGMFNPPRLTVRGGLSVRQSPQPVALRAAGMFNPPRLTVRGRMRARRSLRLGGRYTLRARLGIRGVCVVDDDWILRFKREEVL